MILYALRCSVGHHFDAWFRDGAAFDVQAAAGRIECPYCADTKVTKAPMAPRIARRTGGAETNEERARELASRILETVQKLRRHVEENCEHVGDRFADEARRIHHGEAEERPIYGEATDREASELDDEGISVARLPFWPRRNS